MPTLGTLNGDWTPARCPVRVTAGDTITITDPFGVYNEVDGEEEAAVLGTVIASCKKKRRSNAEAVIEDLGVSVAGHVISFDPITIPNTPGEYWWDLEVEIDGIGPVTLISDHFTILGQVSAVEAP